MNDLITWLRRGALVAGAPLLSNCGPWGSGCPDIPYVVQWDGGGAGDGGAPSTCDSVCGVGARACTIVDAGVVSCLGACIGGRAPPGLSALSKLDASAGSWLARMAELEAAAVHAFYHLANELDAHGLNAHASYALTAAQHEVRHARELTRLALGEGHCPVRHPIAPTELRSLEEVALDNGGEGCGREVFGALLNAHQAQTASSLELRRAMAGIATEERSHAAFSFDLAAALMPRLTLAQRRRVREAQQQTLEALAHEELPVQAAATLGLMNGAQLAATSRALLDHARL